MNENRIVEGIHKGCVEATVYTGSCCYVLLAESAYKDTAAHLPPPLLLDECRLVHDVRRYHDFAAAVPFVRENQLVTHGDFIPGLMRLGSKTHTPSAYASETSGRNLKVPIQHSTHSVVIPNLAISMDATVFRYAVFLFCQHRNLQRVDLDALLPMMQGTSWYMHSNRPVEAYGTPGR